MAKAEKQSLKKKKLNGGILVAEAEEREKGNSSQPLQLTHPGQFRFQRTVVSSIESQVKARGKALSFLTLVVVEILRLTMRMLPMRMLAMNILSTATTNTARQIFSFYYFFYSRGGVVRRCHPGNRALCPKARPTY
jgi:hypothetical protein